MSDEPAGEPIAERPHEDADQDPAERPADERRPALERIGLASVAVVMESSPDEWDVPVVLVPCDWVGGSGGMTAGG